MDVTIPNDADTSLACILSAPLPLKNCGVFVT